MLHLHPLPWYPIIYASPSSLALQLDKFGMGDHGAIAPFEGKGGGWGANRLQTQMMILLHKY